MNWFKIYFGPVVDIFDARGGKVGKAALTRPRSNVRRRTAPRRPPRRSVSIHNYTTVDTDNNFTFYYKYLALVSYKYRFYKNTLHKLYRLS